VVILATLFPVFEVHAMMRVIYFLKQLVSLDMFWYALQATYTWRFGTRVRLGAKQ